MGNGRRLRRHAKVERPAYRDPNAPQEVGRRDELGRRGFLHIVIGILNNHSGGGRIPVEFIEIKVHQERGARPFAST